VRKETISLVTSLLQTPDYAEVLKNDTEPVIYDSSDSGSDEMIIPKIIEEATDKRDEYLKHF
jgi:hypothetical protein